MQCDTEKRSRVSHFVAGSSLCEKHILWENVLKNQEKHLIYDIFADFGYFSSGFGKKCTSFSPIMQL